MSDERLKGLHDDILVIEDDGEVVGFGLLPGSKLTWEEAAEIINEVFGLPLQREEIEDVT